MGDVYDDTSLDLDIVSNAGPKQKVILRFKCSDLPNFDKKSVTDPICYLWEKDSNDKRKRVGNTEMIADSLNPEFVTEIPMDYYFE